MIRNPPAPDTLYFATFWNGQDMRKSDLEKNHDTFDAAIMRYRKFMEKVIDDQSVVVSAQEKRIIAESILIRLCANWESFVNEHLVDCVNRDHSQLSKYFGVSVPLNPSWDLCHALIFGGTYKDFRSVDDLRGFTKKILPKDSNPFLSISKEHIKNIDEVYAIRNYLSHYSSTSRRKVQEEIYKNKYSMNRFLEPGQFILAHGAKRLWKYFDSFVGASNDMKRFYSDRQRVTD